MRVVEIEIKRRHGHFSAEHVLALFGDPGVDQVVGEDAAAGEELTVTVKTVKRNLEVRRNRRDLGVFFGRQIVEVLVSRFTRVDLVLNTIQTSHQQSREAEVRVAERIREAHFDTACLRAVDERNTDRSRAIARRVGELHRRFKARNQTLIGVDAGVRNGVKRTSVLDHAADVIERKFREPSVAIAREEVLAVLPDGLVDMHARTIVAFDRLRHEGGGFAVSSRYVPPCI